MTRGQLLGAAAVIVFMGHTTVAGAQSTPSQTAPLNTSGRNIPLGGPLSDGEFILGEIDYILTADDQILLDTAQLDSLLGPRLTPEGRDRLQQIIAGRNQAPATDLAELGVTFNYDPATFGLVLGIDPERRQRQLISVSGLPADIARVVQPPARLSGFLTAFVVADYVHRSAGNENGFSSPSVLLDSAVRFGSFVFENEATLDDGFSREASRVVWDDLARTARYTVGDLQPVSRGFAGSSQLAGLSVVRSYSELDPQRNVQPRGQRSFNLDRTATVETFVNGRSVQQARLGPGTYDLRDFPFAQGANDVRLVIRDDSGREEVVSFSINFDRTLLAPGLTEFGLFGGVRSRSGIDGLRYEDEWGASGFFRRGFTESLTAGANFQADGTGAVVGSEIAVATSVGTWGADLAFSAIDGIGEGYAANIGYQRTFIGVGENTAAIALTLQTTSPQFATPGAISVDNRFAWEAGLTWSQSLSETSFISTDAFYSAGRGSEPDQRSLRATYGWRANQRLLWTVEAAYEDRRGQQDYGVRLGLVYRFSPFSSGNAEIDTRRDRARAGYQTSRGRGVGAWNASADVETANGATALNANLTSTQNRAEIGASHQTFFDADGGDISDQRTFLRLGTSLAFADGRFAMSRPIYDSFAILRPHESLAGSPVYVDPQERFYSARSGRLGGAVAHDLSAYSPRLMTYDVPEAPAGYDIGTGTAQLRPAYRSGYLITIGSDYNLSVTGQLVRSDGRPLVLWIGSAVDVERPDHPPIRLFTNASGRFAIQGLRPGKWRLSGSDGGPTYILDIPADAANFVRIGTLSPEPL